MSTNEVANHSDRLSKISVHVGVLMGSLGGWGLLAGGRGWSGEVHLCRLIAVLDRLVRAVDVDWARACPGEACTCVVNSGAGESWWSTYVNFAVWGQGGTELGSECCCCLLVNLFQR